MLIKPWTEVQAPRHLLEDEGGDDQPDLLPQVSIQYSGTASSILVSPHTTRIIVEAIPETVPCGNVTVRYPEIGKIIATTFNPDEYDEDEQLYSAITEKSLKDRFTEYDIPLVQYGKTVAVTVPHFTNSIAANVVAAQLVDFFGDKVDQWITLSPCPLNNNETVNKFLLGTATGTGTIDSVPNIKPPHFITGISGAVNSNLSVKKANLISLVLNAEGQPGFEKLDNDSIIDTSHLVAELLDIKQSQYLKTVSLSARKFNGYSNSGMYI